MSTTSSPAAVGFILWIRPNRRHPWRSWLRTGTESQAVEALSDVPTNSECLITTADRDVNREEREERSRRRRPR